MSFNPFICDVSQAIQQGKNLGDLIAERKAQKGLGSRRYFMADCRWICYEYWKLTNESSLLSLLSRQKNEKRIASQTK